MKVDASYDERNHIRRENDEAFEAGVQKLFRYLSFWEDDLHINLHLEALGREDILEPRTAEDIGLEKWENALHGEDVVLPYRARFPENDISAVPRSSCVRKMFVDADTGIWSGAVLQIARCCRGLQELTWINDETIRPDHLSYLRERRKAIAEELPNLPSSLREFVSCNNHDMPWTNVLPGLDLPNGEADILSTNIRQLSLGLRTIDVGNMPLAADFLFPLDDVCQPLSNTHLAWPLLEHVKIDSFPYVLPSGTWLLDWNRWEWDEENIDDPATAGLEIFDSDWMIEKRQANRNIIRTEHFHRLFISLGYAARRMPRLKTMALSQTSTQSLVSCEMWFWFTPGFPPALNWDSDLDYKPDERVAHAWGFRLKDMEKIIRDGYHGVLYQVKNAFT
ncbi:hypothetical protein BJX64DRAFT_293115 [Aspergillus heterothallicus]